MSEPQPDALHLLSALASMPDALDRITAETPARLAGLRAQLIERLRSDRVMWRSKREETK